MKKIFYKGRFIFMPFLVAGILSLVSFVIMQLWNHLLPDILHVTTITFWQAMGLFVLCKILFGFGGRGGGAPWMHRKQMMAEKFKSMSPEERERFKEHWKDRCNWGNRGRHKWGDWQDADAEQPASAPKAE